MPVVVSLRPNAQDAAPKYAGESGVFFRGASSHLPKAPLRQQGFCVKSERKVKAIGYRALFLVSG